MKMLVELRFNHKAPRDSMAGLYGYFIADNLPQAVAYMDKEIFSGMLEDWKEDGDVNYYPDEEWIAAHQDKLNEAPQFGLAVERDEEFVVVSGQKYQLTIWLEGTLWEEPHDLYYGFTHWDWSKSHMINDKGADQILKLGLAKDIQDWENDE